MRGNYRNMVELESGDWTSQSLNSTTVVFWLNGDLSIRTGHTLTLAPGVKIKGGEYKSIYVNGRLIAEGAQDTPIIFTSEKDDTVCGVGAANEAVCDTNNDGAESVPASGDWGAFSSLWQRPQQCHPSRRTPLRRHGMLLSLRRSGYPARCITKH